VNVALEVGYHHRPHASSAILRNPYLDSLKTYPAWNQVMTFQVDPCLGRTYVLGLHVFHLYLHGHLYRTHLSDYPKTKTVTQGTEPAYMD
jgi:hypothetical protein